MDERAAEDRVRRSGQVVVEPDELGRVDDVVVGEAVEDDRHDRVEDERRDERQRRRQEQVRGDRQPSRHGMRGVLALPGKGRFVVVFVLEEGFGGLFELGYLRE